MIFQCLLRPEQQRYGPAGKNLQFAILSVMFTFLIA
jgi:hypothetical protein